MSLRRSPVAGGQPLDPTTNPNTHGVSTRQPRITPRSSDDDGAIATVPVQSTPYGTLRQLANMPPKPTTPQRRASSAGPPSHRSIHRTPATQARTPGAVHRLGGSTRRLNALTPHGRAAMRELEARRAGLTPAKDRRRSGRQQRETPREDLRALSKLLASTTQPVVPTPQGGIASAGRFITRRYDDLDLDDGLELERPRLSLALGEDDDEDDSLLLPPRSAGLEDENFTVQSIELPRRAISELPPGRLSRGSFGSIRMSDQFADLYELGFDNLGDAFESSFAIGGTFDDEVPDIDDSFPQENTATLRNIGLDQGRISARDSDIRPLPIAFAADDSENNFMFTVPARDVQDEAQPEDTPDSHSVPVVSHSRLDDENNGWDDVVDRIETEEVERPSSRRAGEVDVSIQDTTLQEMDTSFAEPEIPVRKKKVKISKHGIQYPSLPAGVVKKLATTYARTGGNSKAKISKDTLDAIMQASDWFFEQVSEDLGAYAKHAGRKTIDESDIVTLMKRQRQTNATTTPFSLAQKYLPRELLQELRMVPPPKLKGGRRLERVEEAEED